MPVQICDLYQEMAVEAAKEWDGVDTADLFMAIIERTGEDFYDVVERWKELYDPKTTHLRAT